MDDEQREHVIEKEVKPTVAEIQKHVVEELQRYKLNLERMVEQRTREMQAQVDERVRAEEALQEREEQLKTFLDNIPLSAYIKDTEGKYMLVNRYYIQYSGYDRDAIIGRDDYQLYEKRIADQFFRNDQEVITTKEPLTTEERFLLDGNEQINLSVKFPLMHSNGEVYAVGGISMDVTERQLLIQRLKQSKEKAESADRAKSEFLSNITHELRTPLNPIITLVELLLETDLTAEQREFILDIKSAAKKLFSMVTDLIEITRMEFEGVTPSNSPFSIRDLLTSFEEHLEKSVEAKPIITGINVEENVPEIIVGDVSMLREILIKLGDNAVKFTHKGKILLEVTRKQNSHDALWLTFSLTDTGIGISEEKLQTLFHDFTQIDGSSKRRFEGMGLGLTKVRKLISCMEGIFETESNPGSGSRFIFSLPFELYEDATTK